DAPAVNTNQNVVDAADGFGDIFHPQSDFLFALDQGFHFDWASNHKYKRRDRTAAERPKMRRYAPAPRQWKGPLTMERPSSLHLTGKLIVQDLDVLAFFDFEQTGQT